MSRKLVSLRKKEEGRDALYWLEICLFAHHVSNSIIIIHKTNDKMEIKFDKCMSLNNCNYVFLDV